MQVADDAASRQRRARYETDPGPRLPSMQNLTVGVFASIASCNTPDIAHLPHKVGVALALAFERVENLVDEHDMEFISNGRTQVGSTRCRLTLDERARDIQST